VYKHWGTRNEVVRDTGVKLRRFSIFKETACRVYVAHPGDKHYTLGLNVFADRMTDEVRAAYACESSPPPRWQEAVVVVATDASDDPFLQRLPWRCVPRTLWTTTWITRL
jgi:hypothetical protein